MDEREAGADQGQTLEQQIGSIFDSYANGGSEQPAESQPSDIGQTQEDAAGTIAGQQAEANAQNVVQEVRAPEHWSQTDKEAFNSLPSELRPLYLEKVKSIETGYNQKFQDLANQKRQLEAYSGFAEMFDPYRQQLAQNGITPVQYVQQLMGAASRLEADPQSFIMDLAQRYGVTLSGADQGQEDDYVDPALASLRQQYAKLENETRQLRQSWEQSRQMTEHQKKEQVGAIWHDFTTSVNESGQPKHPYADELKDYIVLELNRNPEKITETPQQAFERAYNAVKYAHPELQKQKIQEDLAKAQADLAAKQKEEQKKAEIAKAKQAGQTLNSKSVPVNSSIPKAANWGDAASRAWEELQSH